MAQLSEQELLLLNNFMYIKDSTSKNMKVGDIVDSLLENGVKESSLSGGLTTEDAMTILKELDASDKLCDLKITQTTDAGGIRASCFVDANNEATVAFRGTGGLYDAWKDNVQGEYDTSTAMQELAEKFINEKCGKYDGITVTGHSKGGNLAQYVTIKCGDKVDRCLSYDGQGFNNEFIKENAESIKENAGKIKSVCAYSDYVNILLTSIAGETVYLEMEGNGHYSLPLYELNKKNCDENGNYNKSVEQSGIIKGLDKTLDGLVTGLSFLPDDIEKKISDGLGSLAGLVMGDDRFDLDNLGDLFVNLLKLKTVTIPRIISSYIKEGVSNLFKNIFGGGETIRKGNVRARYVSLNTSSKFQVELSTMRDCQEDLRQYMLTIESLSNKVAAVQKGLGHNLHDVVLKTRMQDVISGLQAEKRALENIKNCLNTIQKAYTKTEDRIVEHTTVLA